jgi:hypothetical protein
MGHLSVKDCRISIIGWTLIGAAFCGVFYSALYMFFCRPTSISCFCEPVLRICVWGGFAGCLLAVVAIIIAEACDFSKIYVI